jgi:hypothetical protein
MSSLSVLFAPLGEKLIWIGMAGSHVHIFSSSFAILLDWAYVLF